MELDERYPKMYSVVLASHVVIMTHIVRNILRTTIKFGSISENPLYINHSRKFSEFKSSLDTSFPFLIEPEMARGWVGPVPHLN